MTQEIRTRPAMLPARALLGIQSWLILLLAVSLVVLFDFSLTEAASRKIACGAYSIHLAAGSPGKGGDSLQIVDGKGTLAYQLVGNRIEVGECKDLTADGTPELMVTVYSGGQHCCATHYVLSLSRPVKALLKWESGYDSELEVVNWADVTPAMELYGKDNRLSDFEGIPASISRSLTLPIVFCYENGAYRECTRKFWDPLAADLSETYDAMIMEKDPQKRNGLGVKILALALLLDEEQASWRWMKELSPDVVPWLKGQRQRVMDLMKRSVVSVPESGMTQ